MRNLFISIRNYFFPPMTVAAAIAPLTKIAADLHEVHTAAVAGVTALAHEAAKIDAAIDTHYETMDAAADHIAAISALTGVVAPSTQAQAVANLTGSTVTVVTPPVA